MLSADLHIHADVLPSGRMHGIKPEEIAKGVVDAGLDVYAITNHLKPSRDHLRRVEEEIAKLTEGTDREIQGLLGVEAAVVFDKKTWHLGYVFKPEVSANASHDIKPPFYGSYADFELWRMDHPGIAIFNHPLFRYKDKVSEYDIIRAILREGCVDGVEVMNGSILMNGSPDGEVEIVGSLKRIGYLFSQVREKVPNLAPMACSDAHRKEVIGSVRTVFDETKYPDIFEAVRAGDTHLMVDNDVIKERLAKAREGSHLKVWDCMLELGNADIRDIPA